MSVVKSGAKVRPVRASLWAALCAIALWGAPTERLEAQSPLPSGQSAPVRIMPLGDSLTSSIDGEASYRYWLWHLLQNAGYNVTFVGTQWGVGDGASGIYPNFNQHHEGHSGATTRDILYGLSGWAQQDQPDVVLLLIGANDFPQGFPVSTTLANTYRIIQTLREVNPQVAILWAMLPPASDEVPQVAAYNGALPHFAQRWSTAQSPIEPINLYANFFPAHDTVDGVHPNASGEKKFANRFFLGLVPVLARFGQRLK